MISSSKDNENKTLRQLYQLLCVLSSLFRCVSEQVSVRGATDVGLTVGAKAQSVT